MKMQVLVLMFLSASVVQAQGPAQNFGDLHTRIPTGTEIRVLDSSGKATKGKFGGIVGGSLRLTADGAAQDFPELRIREVRQRRSESRWDGVLMGLGIGAAAGAATIYGVCHEGSERAACYAVGWAFIVPIFAGAGAGTGALIDFAIRRHDVVFIAPVLDTRWKGVRLSISF